MVAFGLMIALFIALSGASYVLIGKTNESTQDIARNWLQSIKLAG